MHIQARGTTQQRQGQSAEIRHDKDIGGRKRDQLTFSETVLKETVAPNAIHSHP